MSLQLGFSSSDGANYSVHTGERSPETGIRTRRAPASTFKINEE
jgi:hypothetical protein